MARRGKLVLGLVGVAIVATCRYRYTSAEPPTTALWTEEDLPMVPPPQDNGWQYLLDALAGGTTVPELPEPIGYFVAKLDGPNDDLWEQVDLERITLENFVDEPATAKSLELWHRAMEAPAFVDACPFEITSQCHHLDMVRLHRVALAEVLCHAARGDEETALDRCSTMIGQQGAYLRSVRTPMGAVVSLAMLRASLSLASLVRDRIGQGADVSPVVLERHHRALETLDLDRTILQQVVIGQYIYDRDALAQVNRADGSPFLGDRLWPPRSLYDEGYATARLDEAYVPVMAVARNPAAPTPEAPEPAWSERIVHPVSAKLLVFLDPRLLLAGQIVDMRAELSELESVRSELLAG